MCSTSVVQKPIYDDDPAPQHPQPPPKTHAYMLFMRWPNTIKRPVRNAILWFWNDLKPSTFSFTWTYIVRQAQHVTHSVPDGEIDLHKYLWSFQLGFMWFYLVCEIKSGTCITMVRGHCSVDIYIYWVTTVIQQWGDTLLVQTYRQYILVFFINQAYFAYKLNWKRKIKG